MKKHILSLFIISAVMVTAIAPAFSAYGDFVPPVANFSATAKNATTVTLSWDTPQYANASSFDIRFSTSPITEANFDTANKVMAGVPLPISGITQTMDVTGLTANTAYYFAIRVINNFSAFSSAVFSSTTTLAGSNSGGGSSAIVVPPASNFSMTATETQATLSWDTPQNANANSFELRYSTSVLNDGNFISGTLVVVQLLPISGIKQTTVVSGLTSGTHYYFGLRLVNGPVNSPIVYTSGETVTPASTGGSGNVVGGGGGGNYDGRVGVFVNVGGASIPPATDKPTIAINGGAKTTYNRSVILSLSANNCASVMLSNTPDFSGASWVLFTSTMPWTLSADYGEKTVYGKCTTISGVVGSVGTSSILFAQPEPLVRLTSNPTHIAQVVSVASVAPEDAFITITPNALTVMKGDRLVVVLTANPKTISYHTRAEISYPAQLLTLEKVEYGKGWAPEFGESANREDATDGVIVKSGHFAGGFREPKYFATLTFSTNNVGGGNVEVATANNTISYTSQLSATNILENTKNSKKYLFANILSIVGDGNYFAFATLLSSLIILYMVYLASRDKKRHGKAFVYHGFRKQ